MLLTQRIVTSGFIIIVFSLLGTVFGLMETFGRVMARTETFIDYADERRKEREKKQRIKENRLEMKQNFIPIDSRQVTRKKTPIEEAKILPFPSSGLDLTRINS